MSIEEGKSGYPEEQPAGADPSTDDTPPNEDASGEGANAPDNDDGTATGNPASAG